MMTLPIWVKQKTNYVSFITFKSYFKAEASGKSPEYIKEAYNDFIKDHPDGKMDKTTFVELMSEERF